MEQQVARQWVQAPVLSGRMVRLEPLGLEHADGVSTAATEPAVFEHLREDRPTTAEEAAGWIEDTLAKPGRVVWAQVDLRTGVPVFAGVTSYLSIEPGSRSLEIGGTWLGRPWWRSGLNTEAKLLLLTRAFEVLGAVRVTWQTDIRNERSQRALERLGAVREGVLRKNRTRKGDEWRDSALYSMIDDEWPAAKKRLSATAPVSAGASDTSSNGPDR